MRSGIWIDNGVVQVVLTPESDHEKALIQLLEGKSFRTAVTKGEFLECRGGYVRQANQNRSLMITLDSREEKKNCFAGPVETIWE